MKTAEQIKEKIKNGGFDTDIFGLATMDLVKALPFENAKEFLKEEFVNSPNATNEWTYYKNDDEVLDEIKNYVDFAQEKIDDERGLSADRSCQHFIAWFWLIDEQFSNKLIATYNYNYEPYGQPLLNKVKKYLADKGV